MALQTKVYTQTSNTYTLELTVAENSTSVSGNSSSVSYTLKLRSTTKDFAMFGVGAKVILNGRLVASRSRTNDPRLSLGTNSGITLLSGTTSIGHSADGTKTMPVEYSLDMEAVSYTPGPMSGSGSMTLTKIPRGATITSAPNFTDEDNPVVKFSNPGNASMELCIKSGDESKILVAYRGISGSSYTFNLTKSERESLQKYSTKNTASVVFVLRSVLAGDSYFSTSKRTLTIKNPFPTLDPSVMDTNPDTVALTGDSNVMVRYKSNAQVTIGAQAVKFATIKSKSVTCAGKSLSGDGTINGVESGDFSISATDSRGNTTAELVKKSLVPYIRPTCYIGQGVPNGTGQFDLNVSGDCFNGNFGVAENQITVEYRFALQGEELGEWSPMSVSASGNGYSATAHIEGLNYKAAYTFQARVVDSLETVESEQKVVSARAIAEWWKDGFQFNVPVFLKEEQGDGEFKVRSLQRCGMTISLSSNAGTIKGGKDLSLLNVISSYGGASVVDGGISVPNDGAYIVSGAVHVTSGPTNAWVGCYVGTSSLAGSASLAYEALPGGAGTVVATPSIVALNAGDRVFLRIEAPQSGVTVNADSRTRLTVAQIA